MDRSSVPPLADTEYLGSRAQSVASHEEVHPAPPGSDGDGSSISWSDLFLEQPVLYGFVLGFCGAHKGHRWTLVTYPVPTTLFNCYCFDCGEGRMFDAVLAEQLAIELEEGGEE